MVKIHITAHCHTRIIERSQEFGLDEYEVKNRILKTIIYGCIPRKHRSKKYKTRCLYFYDNLLFYVIFCETINEIFVKTVIIEEGRE